MAERGRSIDEVIRGLNEKYGHLCEISPRRATNEKVMGPAFSAFVTPNPFDQLHEPPPPYTPSPPAPASFSQPARVSSLPIFQAPLFTPFPSVPVSAPDLLSHESPFRTRVLSAPVEPFLFGRKALQPPLLTMFSRQIFRPWLDRFTEFL